MPACTRLGIEPGLAMRLMPRFFNGVGGIYRQSAIQSDVFLRTLGTVGSVLLSHADECKYHASEKHDEDIGWDRTISLLEAVRLPDVQIDKDEDVAYHDVFFPIIEGEGTSRIRSVFHFTAHKPNGGVSTHEFHGRILNSAGMPVSMA